ncbi:MAG: type I 3-dehydroquinate dehydratase [Persephonella sp.]|nr:type I 3-dehydroquinate dehydratase [Persephonella sp.]
MSYHDFEKTPDEDFIQSVIDRAVSLGADIVKYAFKVNSHEDVSRILCVTAKNRDKKIVAIGMGNLVR